jgi:hypothetical protein
MNHHDRILRQQGEHIARIGWSVTVVFPNAHEPGPWFGYTIGLTAHDQPELVIAGIPNPHVLHAILNDLAERVHRDGMRLRHGQRISDLLVGYDTVIIDGTDTSVLHPGTAIARYGAARIRLRQIVWPDQAGHFPWDTGYAYPPHVQPLIGRL